MGSERTITQEVIEEMFSRGVLVNHDLFAESGRMIAEDVLAKLEVEADLIVLNSDYVEIISQEGFLVDWYDIDRYRVDVEKERDDELYQAQLQQFRKSTLILGTSESTQQQEVSSLETAVDPISGKTGFSSGATTEDEHNDAKIAAGVVMGGQKPVPSTTQPDSSVTVVISYENKPHKYVLRDFTNFFLSRYRFLEAILRNRQELQNTLTINRLSGKKEKEAVSIIGLVDEISEARSGNLIITLEDMTGKIKALISKNKKDLFSAGKDLVVDEVVGISGMCSDNFIFIDNIVWPDIPSSNEMKKGPEEEYAIFLSDIHVGSNLFLKKEFRRFLQWINGEIGSETQRSIAQKVKYIVIAGDLVDGVGIYPAQEDELEITDIREQYMEFCRLAQQIPASKQIIICPGNHDAVHLAEPQSIFYQEFAAPLYTLPNLTLVTNPALVNIGKTDTFSGFDVLLYHGYSFDYYIANVESIRTNGGYQRSDLVMKFLLKRRHLAPSFKCTPYYPAHREDPFLIKKIPDFLITGHIHYCSVANYKGITTVSGSCWQAKTSFQEKLGHEPEPARVPIVNLKTREIKVLKFG